MGGQYPLVPLGELLALDERREEVVPGRKYRQVGVRAYGQGLFVKSALDGAQTTYRSFNRLYVGAVVLSQVKGWEGALDVCPMEMDGLYVSPEYRTFRPSESVDRDYLKWLLTSSIFWRRLGRLTRGVGGRRERIRPEMFLQLDIPLPPLPEQWRIVARIEELAPKIEEARGLRQETTESVEILLGTTAGVFESDSSTVVGDYASIQNGYAFKSDWFSTSSERQYWPWSHRLEQDRADPGVSPI